MLPQTGIAILDWILSFLDAWGYLIVIFFTVFENIFIIGTLTPGETIVIAAAFVSTHGSLALPLVWVCSLVGTLIGSNITYWVGRRLGLEAFRASVERVSQTRIGRLLKVDPSAIDEVQAHFDADGSKTVFFSRFAVGAKNMVPAMAGAVRMPVFWFEFHTVFSATIYTSLMCAIGWFLGENMQYALRVSQGVSWFGLLVLLTVAGVLLFSRRRAAKRREAARAQTACAGDVAHAEDAADAEDAACTDEVDEESA